MSIPSPGGASRPIFAEKFLYRMLPDLPFSALAPGVVHPSPVRSTLATVGIQRRKMNQFSGQRRVCDLRLGPVISLKGHARKFLPYFQLISPVTDLKAHCPPPRLVAYDVSSRYVVDIFAP